MEGCEEESRKPMPANGMYEVLASLRAEVNPVKVEGDH
jgi:hypothetical protein